MMPARQLKGHDIRVSSLATGNTPMIGNIRCTNMLSLCRT